MTNKVEFLFQYGQVWSANDLTTYQDRTFLSVLQLIFAIGAIHAHLIEADDPESPECSSVSTYEGQILVVAKAAKLWHHNQCDESDDEASLVSSSRTNSFSISRCSPTKYDNMHEPLDVGAVAEHVKQFLGKLTQSQ